jgi:hypothetical protein
LTHWKKSWLGKNKERVANPTWNSNSLYWGSTFLVESLILKMKIVAKFGEFAD